MKKITLLFAILLFGFSSVVISQTAPDRESSVRCSSELISSEKKDGYNQSFPRPSDPGRDLAFSLTSELEGYLYVKEDGYWVLVNQGDCMFSYSKLKNSYFKDKKEFAWASDLKTKPKPIDLEVRKAVAPKKWKVD